MIHNSELVRTLELKLMEYYPDQYLDKYVTTVRDVYEHRSALKRIACDDHVLRRVLHILVHANQSGVRYRTLDCLAVVRSILRSKNEPCVVDSEVIETLFYLFQRFIFHRNEEVQSCVNSFLIGQPLEDDHIEWIIENSSSSHHLINRLLRYPLYHSKVAEWAERIYKTNLLPDRLGEVIGCMCCVEIPTFVQNNDKDTLLWAIYYSRMPVSAKARLLADLIEPDNIETLFRICDKLKDPTAIKLVHQKLGFFSENQFPGAS